MSMDKIRGSNVGKKKENSKTRNKHVLDVYFQAGGVPGTGDAEVKKKKKKTTTILAFGKLIVKYRQ